jgi:hypothetical protein
MGKSMNIDDIKEYVTNQVKSYRVGHILKKYDDAEWTKLYEQINAYKPYETERRLIDFARMELDKFRYVLYTERHYEELLIDKACIECLRYEDMCCQERRYYVRRPQS